jgi:hypothetical protein
VIATENLANLLTSYRPTEPKGGALAIIALLHSTSGRGRVRPRKSPRAFRGAMPVVGCPIAMPLYQMKQHWQDRYVTTSARAGCYSSPTIEAN